MVNTCSKCPTRWSGTQTCHCSGCHLTFTGLTAFDKHRKNFTCQSPQDVGLVQHRRGGDAFKYEAWGFPHDDDAARRFSAYREERAQGVRDGETGTSFEES